MNIRCLWLVMLLGACSRCWAVDGELVGQAEDGLRTATTYLTTRVAAGGGYLGGYLADLSEQWGETPATKTQNWIQPPGSPSVGFAFMEAWQATGEQQFLEAAVEVARALAQGQLACGGWDYIVDHAPAAERVWFYRRNRDSDDPALRAGRNTATFDDDVTQHATRLLIAVDLALEGQDPVIREAVDAALDFILEAQHESGGWPQRFPPRGMGYADFLTFNDNSIRDCADVMMIAHRAYGDERFAEAVRRCGEFIIRVQLPEPQATWAQQYDHDLKPAWARRFEPPSACSSESIGVMRLLIAIAVETGDEKYLAPIPPALDWFERSRLPDGRMARFYELGTNRPLYFTMDYMLTYSDEDMPTHYSFKGAYSTQSVVRAMERIEEIGLEAYAQALQPRWLSAEERLAAARAMEENVRKVLAERDEEGRWVTTRGGYMPGDAPRLDMQTWQRNMKVLSDYLKLVNDR